MDDAGDCVFLIHGEEQKGHRHQSKHIQKETHRRKPSNVLTVDLSSTCNSITVNGVSGHKARVTQVSSTSGCFTRNVHVPVILFP